MAVAELKELRTCATCGREKPIHEFYTWKRNDKVTLRGDCVPCYRGKFSRSQRMSRIRVKVKNGFRKAPERALLRIILDDPDLFNIVAKRVGVVTMKRYIYEEKKKIFAEMRHASVKFLSDREGVHSDVPECWDLIEKEVFGR